MRTIEKKIYAYRIFICYAREDYHVAEKLLKHLISIGMNPFLDEFIVPATDYIEKIKSSISSSHIFIPLITEISEGRPWVHQEIGYALGRNVPVLPVVIGVEPKGIIERSQAFITNTALDGINRKITPGLLDQIVMERSRGFHPIFECAEDEFDRQQLLVDKIKDTTRKGQFGRVRIYSGFTAFGVPDKHEDHPDWDVREGIAKRPKKYRERQWEERKLLETNARECGCDLIINPRHYVPENENRRPSRPRLNTLKEFLESMPDNKVRVVIKPERKSGNLLIVGDWFVAESISRGPLGYVQTVCTHHAPTVLARIEKFDEEMNYLLDSRGLDGPASRVDTIKQINAMIDSLE